MDEFAKEDEKYGWFRLIFLIKVNYIVKLDEYGSNLQKQEILVVLDRHMSDMARPKKITLVSRLIFREPLQRFLVWSGQVGHKIINALGVAVHLALGENQWRCS
jgi:hypothetical protein